MARRLLLGAAAGLLLAMPISAQAVHRYRVGIDVDNDPSTGCAVQVDPNGPSLAGLELILELSVDPKQPPTVVGATLAECIDATGMVGPPQSLGGGWPVGVHVGVDGADMVEGFLPRSAVGGAQVLRLVFWSRAESSAWDVLATANGRDTDAPLLLALAQAAPAPALGLLGLGASVLLLIAIGCLRRRRGAWPGVLVAVIVGSIGLLGIASAAHRADGDPSDWSLGDLLGLDALGDAQPPDPAADIIAGFASASGDVFSVRIDVARVAGAPTPTATATATPTATATGSSTATETSPISTPTSTFPFNCGTPGADNDGDGFLACTDDCNDNNPNIRPNHPGEMRSDNSCDGVDVDCSQPYFGCEPKTACFETCNAHQQECGEWNAGCGVFVDCGECNPGGIGFQTCVDGKCCEPTVQQCIIFSGACGGRIDDGCGRTLPCTCPSGICVDGQCEGTGACIPHCAADAQCGEDDGCGGGCRGACDEPKQCLNFGTGYMCTSITTTSCSEVACGLCDSGSGILINKACAEADTECRLTGGTPEVPMCVPRSPCDRPCNGAEVCNIETRKCECCANKSFGGPCEVCIDGEELCSFSLSLVGYHCCRFLNNFCV